MPSSRQIRWMFKTIPYTDSWGALLFAFLPPEKYLLIPTYYFPLPNFNSLLTNQLLSPGKAQQQFLKTAIISGILGASLMVQWLRIHLPGLPWWRSGWESACQCRGHGFGPWSGKIPHAAEQLSPWATTTEPACLEPVLRNGRGCDSERPAHRDEEWPPLATTGESPPTETKTQHSQK